MCSAVNLNRLVYTKNKDGRGACSVCRASLFLNAREGIYYVDLFACRKRVDETHAACHREVVPISGGDGK
jgi:hypothetical protein